MMVILFFLHLVRMIKVFVRKIAAVASTASSLVPVTLVPAFLILVTSPSVK